MTQERAPADVDRFRAVIALWLGLRFDDGKLAFLDDVFGRRLALTGLTVEAYLSRPPGEGRQREITALASELTVGETYFFRNVDQFHAFSEIVLPQSLAVQAATRRLHILSAGCSSGEEAYSLAILVREAHLDRSWDVSIVGVDLNPAALEKARRARFSAWALRETPADVSQRWFQRDGADFVLDPAVQASVRFECRNLVEDDPQLWPPALYDAIFCRNVLMYLTPDAARAVVLRMAGALRPGGHLFLGSAETLRGLSGDFHLEHTHGTFYYRHKDRLETMPVPIPDTAEAEGAWVEARRTAGERIATLTPCASPHAADPSPLVVVEPAVWDLGPAVELLQKERFTEALGMIDALPPESGRDADVLLLHAVLLTQDGQLPKAEDACRRLLEVDELNAGAHYLLALCREGNGELAGAVHHDRTAVYLDPHFAMPRLHLGLLARRAGDRQTARKELGQAITLLQREDPSRVLLFGGGFGREALVTLCRAELLGCGERQ